MSISVPVIKRCIGVWGEGVPVVRLALRGPIAISVAARRRRRRASVGVRSGGGPVVEATDVDVRWRHKSCNRLKSRSTFRRCAPRLQYADSDAFPQLAAARRGALAALADAPAEDGIRPTQPRPRYRRPAACRRFFLPRRAVTMTTTRPWAASHLPLSLLSFSFHNKNNTTSTFRFFI